MNARNRTIALALALVLSPFALVAARAGDGGTHWLHVRVEDRSGDGENVRVNLPVELIATVLPRIGIDEHIQNGLVTIDSDDGVALRDLRTVWEQLRGAADGEYVRVEGGDGNVRVRKAGERLEIDVRDGTGDEEKVRVRVPLAVVDALFSAPEGQLDVAAAIEALAASGTGELVHVEDGESTVRIWIDDRPESP